MTGTTKADALHGILPVKEGANLVDLTTRDTIADDLPAVEEYYDDSD